MQEVIFYWNSSNLSVYLFGAYYKVWYMVNV